MDNTKTVAGYIAWGVYTLLICTLLTLGIFGITADYQITDMTYRILCAGLFFLVLFGASYFIYSMAGQFITIKHMWRADGTAIEMLASATVFLFLGAFALKRLVYSITYGSDVLIDSGDYFRLAMLTQENTGIPWMEHIASYAYTACSAVCA